MLKVKLMLMAVLVRPILSGMITCMFKSTPMEDRLEDRLKDRLEDRLEDEEEHEDEQEADSSKKENRDMVECQARLLCPYDEEVDKGLKLPAEEPKFSFFAQSCEAQTWDLVVYAAINNNAPKTYIASQSSIASNQKFTISYPEPRAMQRVFFALAQAGTKIFVELSEGLEPPAINYQEPPMAIGQDVFRFESDDPKTDLVNGTYEKILNHNHNAVRLKV